MGALGDCKIEDKFKKENEAKKMFQNLCMIQCTKDEIAGVFEVSDSTLSRWVKKTYNTTFEDAYKVYSSSGRASLRRNQFKLSEKSAAMSIFLGKQYLGQSDVIENRLTKKTEDDPLTISIQQTIEKFSKIDD